MNDLRLYFFHKPHTVLLDRQYYPRNTKVTDFRKVWAYVSHFLRSGGILYGFTPLRLHKLIKICRGWCSAMFTSISSYLLLRHQRSCNSAGNILSIPSSTFKVSLSHKHPPPLALLCCASSILATRNRN